MTERQIRIFGDPVLKTPSLTINTVDAGVRGLVEDLLDSVRPPGRAGVAAPQIGVNLRAFSYNVDGVIGYILNPEIIELGGEPQPVDEGCLSVPNLWYPAIRYPHAKVRGTDLDGNDIVLEGDGLMAQALQHECDHLDGRLYLDRLSKDDRRAAMKAVRESHWF
ncbi:peptide deformylase [Rathayibacter rathayi]|uniref:Peptide deformylase n=1 Tax=Rathayibacter rathayi TaxID=33887 RepID=A0ABD6WAD5_RATRA|nr:peptide deformylase [Rathayibacter rathayi]AZZ48593.1 peptide deformylase [Rathayibacter rathayi]MWV74910.1 peptide deformylase [Rathayibacter rathayi NCPPB 2980 = VKM Ac-1601]PPF14683.1 peptide deformylase [Rathayibacter rathayi]PPG69317.1 peptide deformylase [Rathayibacter rathayi]PPG79624.1 peptide deformylase [Rathayibacter rathayi]